ncbi:aci13 [Ranunculus cassubicifolius]
MARNPLLPEIGPDGLARENPVIGYTERKIEEEQHSLQRYIQENYSKIRDVERELQNLTLEVKLTSGPKKAALEHLRKKIEVATEKIRLAKIKEEEAKKVWEEAAKVVKDEEALKQKLCDDLNQLVQESSNTQFSRLEELKRRLEALNPSRPSVSGVQDVAPVQTSVPAQAATTETANKNQVPAPAANGLPSQQQASSEGAKKKLFNPGRGKGLGFAPKGKGPGWTGAGFDVDGRS